MTALNLRPARPEDEAAVVELSSHIWDGEDYVPHRFSDWLGDEYGEFTVAYVGEKLVGFGKLTRLAPGEWWLEGLRVHPDYRERGIGSRLHRYGVALADRVGTGMLRFATSSRNETIHRLARETGFHFVSAHIMAGTEVAKVTAEPGRLFLLAANQLSEVRHWLATSLTFAAAGGLWEEQWKWRELKPCLALLQGQRRLYGWQRHSGRLDGVAVVTTGNQETLWLNYLDVPAAFLAPFVADLSALARSLNLDQVKGKPLAGSSAIETLAAAGWHLEPDFSIWVFEKALSN
jgi:GNAT superfamily N-acetyltransferase